MAWLWFYQSLEGMLGKQNVKNFIDPPLRPRIIFFISIFLFHLATVLPSSPISSPRGNIAREERRGILTSFVHTKPMSRCKDLWLEERWEAKTGGKGSSMFLLPTERRKQRRSACEGVNKKKEIQKNCTSDRVFGVFVWRCDHERSLLVSPGGSQLGRDSHLSIAGRQAEAHSSFVSLPWGRNW